MTPQEAAATAAKVETTIREEIPGANAALSKLGWSILIASAGAVANAVPTLVPVVWAAVVPHIPQALQSIGGMAISSGSLALIAFLNGLAKHDTKKAVSTAYISEPNAKTSEEIKAVYTQ